MEIDVAERFVSDGRRSDISKPLNLGDGCSSVWQGMAIIPNNVAIAPDNAVNLILNLSRITGLLVNIYNPSLHSRLTLC